METAAIVHERTAQPGTRIVIVTLVIMVIVGLWFAKLPGRVLTHVDEGRYAEISREMAVSGDFVTPRLNGFKYFEKPPLQYWATALAFQAFGVSEWTARLWTAFTGLLVVAATWFTGRRLFGDRAGMFGALALLASPYFLIMSAANSLDMSVSAFLSIAVYAYLLSRQPPPGRVGRPWMIVAWAAMALAVLSKGLIGVVLPFGTLIAYSMLERDLRAWRDLQWLPGIAVFLAIAAPWFVLVSIENPEFPAFFFVHEHFQRFTSDVHVRGGALWYFMPVLLVAIAPWMLAAAQSFAAAWRERPEAETVSPSRFLAVWAVAVFGFFSVSQSKLPGYILPIVPALALLAGHALANMPKLRALRGLAAGAMVAGVLTYLATETLETIDHGVLAPHYEAFARWTELSSLLLVLAGGVGAYLQNRSVSDRLLAGLLASFYVAGTLGIVGFTLLAPLRSTHEIAAKILAEGPPGVPVYAVRDYDQTLPFYLGRTVTLVDFTGEFALGIAAEPERWVPTLEAFDARWRADPRAFAVMSRETFAMLETRGVPMQVVSEDRRWLLVRKPPA